MRTYALTAMALLLAAEASAQAPERFELATARDLVALCAPAQAGAAADSSLAFCYGFIAGGGELYAKLIDADAIRPWACAEPPPTLDEIRSAFIAWARANPDSLGWSPADAFWQAMASAYPCA
jgi:hypothetical protein